MEYSFHSYPRELAKQIIAQWDIASGVADTLPPEDALASFLNETYQASLLREEDRAVVCRLILIDPAELVDYPRPPPPFPAPKFHQKKDLRHTPTPPFNP